MALDTTTATGTIANGDWLQLVFTTQETASGSFKGTFSLLDYGPTGVAVPTTVLAPVAYTVSGLTTVGTAAAMYAGFRTANSGRHRPLEVRQLHGRLVRREDGVPPAARERHGRRRRSASFVAARRGHQLQHPRRRHLHGHADAQPRHVRQRPDHGHRQAVNGIATFSNLSINAAGSYILRATDTNPNLDPGFAPFTINAASRRQARRSSSSRRTANAGATISPAVTVAVEDANGNTVTSNTSTVTLTLSSGTLRRRHAARSRPTPSTASPRSATSSSTPPGPTPWPPATAA